MNESLLTTIHFIWLGSSLKHKKEGRVLKSWALQHEHYDKVLWTDHNCLTEKQIDELENFCNDYNFSLRFIFPDLITYDKLKNPVSAADQHIQKCLTAYTIFRDYPHPLWSTCSDILRWIILYMEGGIYLDTDILPAHTRQEVIIKNATGYSWEDISDENLTYYMDCYNNYLPPEERDTFPLQGIPVDNDQGIRLSDLSQVSHQNALQQPPFNKLTDKHSLINCDFIAAAKYSPFIEGYLQSLAARIESVENFFNEMDQNYTKAIMNLGPAMLRSFLRQQKSMHGGCDETQLVAVGNGKPDFVLQNQYLLTPYQKSVLSAYNFLSWLPKHQTTTQIMPLKAYEGFASFYGQMTQLFQKVSEANNCDNTDAILTLAPERSIIDYFFYSQPNNSLVKQNKQ